MAAQQGTFTFLSKKGRTFSIDVHCPDAAGTLITMNSSGAAASTSPNQYRLSEDSTLIDFSVAVSPTATGMTLNVNSGNVNGGVLRHANHLVTLVNRQNIAIPLSAGDFIGATQFA